MTLKKKRTDAEESKKGGRQITLVSTFSMQMLACSWRLVHPQGATNATLKSFLWMKLMLMLHAGIYHIYCNLEKFYKNKKINQNSSVTMYKGWMHLWILFFSLLYTYLDYCTVCGLSGQSGARQQLTVPVSSDYMTASPIYWTDNIITWHHTKHYQIMWAVQLHSEHPIHYHEVTSVAICFS